MSSKLKCFHCGNNSNKKCVNFNDRIFCSHRCQSVYKLLSKNNLITYYGFEKFPGKIPKPITTEYSVLKDEKNTDELYDFIDKEVHIITLNVPQIRGNSCVWLLENLGKLSDAIIASQVDYLKKEARIVFDNTRLSLLDLVELLSSIGYQPFLKFEGKLAQKRKFYHSMLHKYKNCRLLR